MCHCVDCGLCGVSYWNADLEKKECAGHILFCYEFKKSVDKYLYGVYDFCREILYKGIGIK